MLKRFIMTLFEFKALPRSSQIDAICDCGVRLAAREELEYNITLYQIEDFYVEIFYDRQLKQISYIKASNNTILLEPYLDSINIGELLQGL
jgi:hypothetical protein